MKYDLYSYRFGVNYTPTRNWWYCWNDFVPDAIARDLDNIAQIGADHIRVMLLWPYFQPNPDQVSAVHLERLQTLMTLARERKLDVCLSMLVGWLSGYHFRPFFDRGESIYTSEQLLKAQDIYFRAVAKAVAGFDNFLGFDLGNELDCTWKAKFLEDGDRWHDRMMALASELFPLHVHSNGVDHQPWFWETTFSPQTLAQNQPAAILHMYTFFTGALNRNNGDNFAPECIHLLAATAALARAYARDPAKPVWAQEYGMSEEWMEKESIPRFLEEATLSGIQGGVSWFTWWSSHDLDRRFRFNPLEYSLGLVTNDGKIKPQGEAFREIAQTYRGQTVDRAKLARQPLLPPPETHDNAGTWKWLEHWVARHVTARRKKAVQPAGEV